MVSDHSHPYHLLQWLILLADLFIYSSATSQELRSGMQRGLDTYWKGGLANLNNKLESYELLEATEGAEEGSMGSSRTSGGP
jgi:hypothetical protein